jgi:glucose uptake protein GlcU
MVEKEGVGNGLGTSGFTLGILSIIFAGWIGIIIAVIGGIFCFVQQKNRKMRIAKVGLILNIVGLVLSILFILLYPMIANLLGGLSA